MAAATATEGAHAGILGTEPENVDDDDAAQSLGSVGHALMAGLSLQAFLDPTALPTGAQVAAAIRAITKQA